MRVLRLLADTVFSRLGRWVTPDEREKKGCALAFSSLRSAQDQEMKIVNRSGHKLVDSWRVRMGSSWRPTSSGRACSELLWGYNG